MARSGMRAAKAASSRLVEVELQHVSLKRGGRSVLRDIAWHVRPGERWVVVGPNGAGKTQLLKILAGAVWPDPDVRHVLRWRWRRQWRRVPQELLQEIAYLGPERQDQYERRGWNHSVRDVVGTGVHRSDIPLQRLSRHQSLFVAKILRQLRLTSLAARGFLTLSYGERRRVLLARALAARPGLLLMDELLTGLDTSQRRALLNWLESSAASQLPWVLSAHRKPDIPAAATHVLMLDAGRIRYCGSSAGAALAAYFKQPPARSGAAARTGGQAAYGTEAKRRRMWFRFRNANIHLDYRRIIRGLDWQVNAGECWIIRGANGSGKSTLLRTIYGDHAVASDGWIERRGVGPGIPLDYFKSRCGFVAPHLQTDFARDAPVLDVVVSGLHSSIGLNEPSSSRERARARKALGAVGAAAHAERVFGELSYGEARRIIFARALVCRPGLLLLDEAFAGLDVRTRHDLLSLVDRLSVAGVAVVLATHQREELPRTASHELLLRGGQAIRLRSLLPKHT